MSTNEKNLVWSGPMRPPVRGADGVLSHALYVWSYDDGSVQVSADRLSEMCDPTEDELVGALSAAVRGLVGAVTDAVTEEREACLDVCRGIYQGNTEIPIKDTPAWYECAEFIADEIRGRE